MAFQFPFIPSFASSPSASLASSLSTSSPELSSSTSDVAASIPSTVYQAPVSLATYVLTTHHFNLSGAKLVGPMAEPGASSQTWATSHDPMDATSHLEMRSMDTSDNQSQDFDHQIALMGAITFDNAFELISRSDLFSLPWKILLIIIVFVQLLVGVGLNSLTIYAVAIRRRLQHTCNLLIFTLNCTDLANCIVKSFSAIATLFRLNTPPVPTDPNSAASFTWIRLVRLAAGFTHFLASMILITIAIDRRQRIMSGRPSVRDFDEPYKLLLAILKIAACCIIAAIMALPSVFWLDCGTLTVHQYESASKICVEALPDEIKTAWSVTIFMADLVIPLLVIFWSYYCIRSFLSAKVNRDLRRNSMNRNSALRRQMALLRAAQCKGPKRVRAMNLALPCIKGSGDEQAQVNGNPPVSSGTNGSNREGTGGTAASQCQTAEKSAGQVSRPNSLAISGNGSNRASPDGPSMSNATLETCDSRLNLLAMQRRKLQRERNRNNRACRILFYIVVAFAVVWTPWHMFRINAHVLGIGISQDSGFFLLNTNQQLILATMVTLWASFSPIVNCVFYGWLNTQIRQQLYDLCSRNSCIRRCLHLRNIREDRDEQVMAFSGRFRRFLRRSPESQSRANQSQFDKTTVPNNHTLTQQNI